MTLRLLFRELAFLALTRLERLRRLFRRPIESASLTTPQYMYGSIGGGLAKQLLLPRFATKDYKLTNSSAGLEHLKWFETSRRIVDYQALDVPDDEQRQLKHQIVVYLFVPDDRRDVTDRLLYRYINKAPVETPRWIYDGEADLLMRSRLLRRFQPWRSIQRWYYEVTILPRDYISVDPAGLLERDGITVNFESLFESYLHHPDPHGSLVTDMDVNERFPAIDVVAGEGTPLSEGSTIALDDGYGEQADSNRRFILSEIAAAREQGRSFDETLVQSIAKKQMAFANRTQNFGDAPGAGPTEESAELMVRSVVDLLLLAEEPDVARPPGDS